MLAGKQTIDHRRTAVHWGKNFEFEFDARR